MKEHPAIGQRVRLNENYKNSSSSRSKYTNVEGTVKKVSRDGNIFQVLWDNAPSSGKLYGYHKDYLRMDIKRKYGK